MPATECDGSGLSFAARFEDLDHPVEQRRPERPQVGARPVVEDPLDGAQPAGDDQRVDLPFHARP